MKKLDKKNFIRFVAVIIFLIVMIIATILLIPIMKSLVTEAGRMSLKADVEKFGAFGWLLFILFQVLQVVVAIIPGGPVEILGGLLYGTFKGFFLSIIGLFLGTVIVFYLVKSIGKPLVYAVVSKEKVNKFSFLNNEKKLELIIFILFLIPGTSKDVLTYIAPLTNVKPSQFFILATLSRIPSALMSSFMGTSIGKGNWIISIVIFVVIAALGIFGILYNEKLISKIKSESLKIKNNFHKEK